MKYQKRTSKATWSEENIEIPARIKYLLYDYVEASDDSDFFPPVKNIYLYSVNEEYFSKHSEYKYKFGNVEFYVFPIKLNDKESILNVIFKGAEINSTKKPVSAFRPEYIEAFIRCFLRDVAKLI